MQRVLVSVTNDLTYDQRVHRVCTTLVKMGYEILLIGRRLPNSKPLERAYSFKRFKLFFNKGFLFYAEYNLRLFFKLLFTKKDILLANDIDTLLPNFFVCKLLNKKLVFDSHELFSEVPELTNRPNVKWFWKKLEESIIPNLKNCYTVSQSIADHYKNLYTTNFKIIRNYPFRISTAVDSYEFPFEMEGNKIIIYQGAINKGRGLELMINAIPFINHAIFLIVGDGDIKKQLVSKVRKAGLDEKVKFLGKVSPEELRNITAQASLGVSLEEDLGLNYRYALPNKLYDYIQAKIPVLVSDLPDMKALVESYDVGIVLKERTPANVAKSIQEILENKSSMVAQLQKAADEFVWEEESKKLKNLFSDLK